MDKEVSKVFMVSIHEIPVNGEAKMLVRTRYDHREMINKAARVMQMSQANFARAVLVDAARRVLKEAGIAYE